MTCLLLLLAMMADIPARAQKGKRKVPATPAAVAMPQERNTAGGDTTLQTTRLEITQVYKPEIKRTQRPLFHPVPPAADTVRIQQSYDVPQQTLNYTYRSLPLRPLALGADTSTLPLQSYLKLGGGNLSTVIAEAGIAALSGQNYSSTIHARHLSQSGNIAGQQTSLTELNADGYVNTGGHRWTASLGGSHNRYRYYGYDHTVFDYNPDTLKQAFTGFHAGVSLQNNELLKGWLYQPAVDFKLFTDKYQATERTLLFDLPITTDIDEYLNFSISVNGALGHYQVGDSISRGNTLVQLAPLIKYSRDGFTGRLGLTPSFGHKTWLLPDINAAYKIADEHLEFGAGWQAQVQRNTYQELSSRNPFMSNFYRQQQSRSDEVHGDARLSFAKYFTINTRLSYWQWTDLPVFLNSYAEIPDGRQFDVINDGIVNAISFQAGLHYQVGETFTIGGTGTWYSFYKSSYSRVWHQPGVRLKADAMFQPIKHLRITAYLSVLDQIYAQNEFGDEIKLPAFIDLGIGASYQVLPQLSFFLQTANLLNRKNERFYHYNSYGFNMYGGLSFSF